MGHDQLTFAFAASPRGGQGARASDGSGGRAYLLRTAKGTRVAGLTAPAADPGRLLEQVASAPNLARALLQVARNRGAPGVDGRSVGEVVGRSHRLMPELRRALLTGDYRPGDVRRVWIPKPGGGQRGLGVPNVVDRWVQQAVLQGLEPIFEPTFHGSSHGFRPGRGAPSALAEAKEHLGSGYTWVVDLDLEQFFDRVHHQRLLARLAQRVGDPRVLDLVRRMLKARVVMPNGTRVSSEQGTPQGGPLSPLLSNVVLDELDRELMRRGLRFVRYADDIHVFVRSERAGRRVMASLGRFLERRLRLRVNEPKSAVRRPEGVQFLGFCFGFKADGTVGVHLSARTRARLDARLRGMTPRSWGQSVAACLEPINVYLRGWMAYFRLCTEDEEGLFRRFDAHLRRRIRAILLAQKKRPRFVFRHLVARGVGPEAAARTAYSGRGPWHRSNHSGWTRAYRNAWFAERLVSLHAEWLRLQPFRSASGQGVLFGG